VLGHLVTPDEPPRQLRRRSTKRPNSRPRKVARPR
jgi:hypothetical protein